LILVISHLASRISLSISIFFTSSTSDLGDHAVWMECMMPHNCGQLNGTVRRGAHGLQRVRLVLPDLLPPAQLRWLLRRAREQRCGGK
jgi:hypothetical protein